MAVSIPGSVTSRRDHPRDPVLSDALRAAVTRERRLGAHVEVLRQGESPTVAHVVLSGYMCRFRVLSDGRRQITGLLLPGDLCDADAVLTGKADYSVGTLTEGRIGELAIGKLGDIDRLSPELRQILLGQILRDGAIAREWMLALGRLSALERTAHLFCELWTRLQRVGLADAGGYDLDVSQGQLSDILGVSSVHVNRTLQRLRTDGLIQFKGGHLRILDYSKLATTANFDTGYLQEQK